MSIRDSFSRLWSCVGSGCNRILPPVWVGRVTPAFAGKLRRVRAVRVCKRSADRGLPALWSMSHFEPSEYLQL